MDVTTLSRDIVIFLAPFLPYLVKAGEKAVEEAGKQLGVDAWEKAKALWSKLRPKVEAKPAMQEAAQNVAETPDDEDAQAALRLQLKKLLREDASLAAEVARLVEDKIVQRVLAERGSQVRDVRQIATGLGSVRQEVIAQDNSTVEDIQQQTKQ